VQSLSRSSPGAALPDPAPSRWAWRLERWLLTPYIRFLMRVGLPFGLCLTLGLWWLSDGARRDAVIEAYVTTRDRIHHRPEFMVSLVAIEGASTEVAEHIREAAARHLPISSFNLDIEALRASIVALDPVKDATVRLQPGGVLDVHITERVPVAVWRSYDVVTVVDRQGETVAQVPSRLSRIDLPLIAGDGADRVVDEALDLIAIARPVGDRVRGLVRLGERRWDMVIAPDIRVMLPETGAQAALTKALALHASDAVLDLDVARIDLRAPQRTTITLNDAATQEWRRIRALGFGAPQAGTQ